MVASRLRSASAEPCFCCCECLLASGCAFTAGSKWAMNVPLQVHRYLVVLDVHGMLASTLQWAVEGPGAQSQHLGGVCLSARGNRKPASAEQTIFVFELPAHFSLLTTPDSPASVPFSMTPYLSSFASPPPHSLLALFLPASQLQFGPSATEAGRQSAACC
jgi:hypothetical protein